MSGKGDSRPDAILGDYLDELLAVSNEGSPWVEDQPERDSGGGQQPEQRRAPTRQRQAAVRVREKPTSSLVSPAFREIPPEVPEEDVETGEPAAPTSVPAAEPEPQPEPELEPEPEPKPAVAPVDPTPSEPAPFQAEKIPLAPEPWDNGRPPWAQEGFECLIFRVAGLQLAVPLVLLGQIHRLDKELTPLVGRPDWFMGLLRVGDQNVRVTDTALWVMPDRYRREFRDGYRFVIQLGDSAWGLACDEVAESFLVQPDEVKWRGQGSRRQWLAGTIRKEMCALLDVARLAELLQKAETQRQPDLDR